MCIRKRLTAMVGMLELNMRDGAPDRHERAQAIAALCVGGMVVARAISNREQADALRESCMGVALRFGGWEQPAQSGAATEVESCAV
jgi:TetR/AcrR family transcriptional repressor of nem operon